MVTISNILLPIDFTVCSTAVLPHARLMKETFGGTLHLLYVMPGPEQYRGIDVDADWFETYGTTLKNSAEMAMSNFILQNMQGFEPKKSEVRSGDAVAETICYTDEEGIDLIITASHGCNTTENRLYGSVAEAISRDSVCPVLIVNP